MNEWIDIETRHGSGATGNWPITLVAGKGTRVRDSQGRQYLDFETGIGVAILGHANSAVAEAIADQANTLVTCDGVYFSNDVRARFVSQLVKIAPKGLSRVFITNSGTEAVECAIKLARANTRRSGIVAATGAFHGRSFGSLSATWKRKYRAPFEPLVPGFTHIPFGGSEALKEVVSDRTAAVILEPVQGEAGVCPAPRDFLKQARQICDETGALLVFDEVQCGMGRTGKWFACEHYQVVPDVLCLAKALGGGFPIGSALFRDDLTFQKSQHGTTFGGNPLACRAALAVMEYIETHDLLAHVTKIGSYFLSGLKDLAAEFPETVEEARGMGLMLAIQLKGKATPVLKKLLKYGVLASLAGPQNIRFLPPYIVSQDEVDEVLTALKKALS